MVGIAAVPPFVVVAAATVAVWRLPRRPGHLVGAALTGLVVPWSVLVPGGRAYEVWFLGFEAVLVNVDGLSRLMGVIFGFIGAIAVLYASASNADRAMTAYAVSYVASSLGAVFAGDWLTLVFFWELMAATSTLLVWQHGGRAIRAGYRYAIAHGVGGSLLMIGVIWHYTAAGTFVFGGGITGGTAAALVALGIGVNVGFIGLHTWLPDTYPRPHTAASVFLCVYSTKTGVYAMARAFPEGNLWIAYMGGAMAVFGAYVALLQTDMRRLLSYHIQSQVGYMIAGIGIGTALAVAGGMAHVFNHILYKSLLFMTAGIVIQRTGEEDLNRLGGLAREMPVTAIVFAVAALSIAGFPGFNGFVSKGMVVTAAHDEHLDGLWWLLIVGGLGTFLSFIKFGYYTFLHGPADRPVADANRGQTIAITAVGGLCVLYGVYPDALFAILPGAGAAEAHPFTVDHVAEGLVLAAGGLVGFALLRGPLAGVRSVPDVDYVYTRAVFYGTAAIAGSIARVYTAADDVAVGLTVRLARLFDDPAAAVRWARFGPSGPTEGATEATLRVGLGVSLLIVIGVLVAVIALLL